MTRIQTEIRHSTCSFENANRVGLVFGALLGGWHIVWSLFVLLGVAQAIYDFILWAHMIHLQITVGPFNAVAALTLIILTSVVGYIIGCIASWVWNYVHG